MIRWGAWFTLAGVVAAAVAITSAASAARLAAISGRLSVPGYTVLAVAADGKVTSVRVSRAGFSLRPPASVVSLQLRAPNGVYGGPIVISTQKGGKVAIVGLRAGAKLGLVKVNARRGYARLGGPLPKRWTATRRWARAKKGVPIGAGDFGLVRSCRACGPPGDSDADGIPNVLDVDVNGNLVLNNLERSGGAPVHSPRAAAAQSTGVLGLTPILPLSIQSTVNADAGGLTIAQADAALAGNEQLEVGVSLPGELDCGGRPDPKNPAGWSGGLSYCTRGGTGRVFSGAPGLGRGPRFPECCDPNNNGMANLAAGGVALNPAATTSQIRSGDLLIEHVTRNATTTDYPATLQYVFATVPALHSYSDTAGNSATVQYPVAPPIPPTLAGGGPGTTGNPFPVAAGADGQVIFTISFWRPQRPRQPGDSGKADWIDIGGLTYLLNIGGAVPLFCPQGSYSTTSSDLTLPPPGVPGPDMQSHQPGGAFTDASADAPADPAHMLTFSVNLTQCLTARGKSFNVGDTLPIQLIARSSNTRPDSAQQAFDIKRTG